MSRYITRLRMRRAYKWNGRSVSKDRKLKRQYYESMSISVEGKTEDVTVSLGQYILIEGDDDDNPFVAQLLKLYTDGKKKTAVVQWFVRMCEVPQNKRKLLGRDPHPQEIFFYQDHSCDDEVDGETILGAVQVGIYVPVEDPFPKGKSKGILFVKLLWDTKSFRALDPELMQPPQSSKSPPPSSRGPQTRALPTPDLSVMKRAMSGILTRGSMSTGKMSSSEAESLHSASKLSAAKALSAKRRSRAVSGPHVRKKLDLCSECHASTHILAEEEHEDAPVQTAATPRSKRKSAQLVSSRIRKQLNLLGNTVDLLSDGEDDDDCFVPAKIDLQSSSDEEEEAKIDSEDELIVKKRRGSGTSRSTEKTRVSARTPRKTPTTPRTPRHVTPSIPSRSAPARKPGNVLEEARARLHVSSVPESLPCREQEFQDIYNFVESKVIDGTGGCMYISGVPGTGKTATVHEVIRSLQQSAEQDEIPHFRFIEINGMKMTDPHQAHVQILQKLTDQKATPDHAAALLEKRFSAPAPKKETTVLLVDELDLLWTRKQNVMYNLFDWPTRRNARLVVLTIANTMDLPERIMINRVASRLGLTRMSFQPYTFKQLQQIITSRLNRVKAFEEDALQLVSRKVAALSGDARRCLDICRRATEICEHSGSQKSSSGLVGMSHVMEALDEMFSSSYIAAIRCASVQEQLFLRAVIAEFRRLGLEEATFQQVFVQHQALCRVEGLQPVNVSEGLTVCQRLGSCRLLLLEGSRLDLFLRIRLNVSQDDVLYALKAD
uniref:Origin recognition complex subunit 1 n=1 Tax=Sinocyclocheilus grahami TaxID=75366 RepID=A0A672N4P5_SINGR